MKYAEFDPAAPQPAPVLGWYDTDLLDYPSLPDASRLLTLTDAQWAGRMATPYVQAGALVAGPSTPAPRVRTMRPYAFRQRFTAAERAGITLKASQDLAAGDASLQVALDDLNAASRVDLDNPELSAMLDTVTAAGILAAGRKDTLLADPTAAELALP